MSYHIEHTFRKWPMLLGSRKPDLTCPEPCPSGGTFLPVPFLDQEIKLLLSCYKQFCHHGFFKKDIYLFTSLFESESGRGSTSLGRSRGERSRLPAELCGAGLGSISRTPRSRDHGPLNPLGHPAPPPPASSLWTTFFLFFFWLYFFLPS